MPLVASQLQVSRLGRVVIEPASFMVEAGQIVGLLGANGSGKSTLIAALAGEIEVQSGDIQYDKDVLATLSTLEQARRRAVLPQTPGLSFSLDVTQVVQMGTYPFEEVLSPAELNAIVDLALQALKLDRLTDRSYLEMSGGEQQRVHLARVMVQVEAALLLHGQAYLLLDEPVSSLDPAFQHELMSFLFDCTRQKKVGVLMAMHDVNLAARWCDTVMLLSSRRLQWQGAPAEVLTEANLSATYGLSMRVMPHPLHQGRLLVLPP